MVKMLLTGKARNPIEEFEPVRGAPLSMALLLNEPKITPEKVPAVLKPLAAI
jgi:hypothetical protein